MTIESDPPDRVAIGTSLSRYVVIEEAGRGGMGRVLRAYDPKLQREVALKEIRGATLGAAGAERLVHEARAMAKLSHPNVVAVYDVAEFERDRYVLVMEYVAGQSLSAWLREPRAWRDVVACFRQAGRGLAAAHAAGLLHRDFKPDNVLVGLDGRVRVTDFGLAREVLLESTDDRGSDEAAASVLDPGERTVSGAVVGTLPYLAPERLMGGPADPATDQFAFCVSLWEALLGARPFAGRSVVELAFAMTSGPPRPPASAPRMPAWLLATITRGLASHAGERWPSMDALLNALARDPAARRRTAATAVLGVGLVGIAAVGTSAWLSAASEPCAERAASESLGGAWDDARRAEVETAMLRVQAPEAEAAWARTSAAIDTLASEWTRMHVETCAATRVRGEQSVSVMHLRMACLQRAKVTLGAITDVLSQADARAVRNADEIVAGLPTLDPCADLDALGSGPEPPNALKAEAVAALRSSLARVYATLNAGQHREAREALEAAQALAHDLSHGPAQAELAVARGVLLARIGEAQPAREALEDALRRAAAERHWDEMLTAATHLVHVVGARLHEVDQAMRYADLALGLAADAPEPKARVERAIARVQDARAQ